MRVRAAVLLTIATLLVAAGSAAAAGPIRPVESVDLTRYQGDWLQLAAIPQFFLADCARDVRAGYELLPDGLVRVRNSCVRADATTKRIEGRARVVDPASNARLAVTFLRFGDRWIFLGGANYVIIGLDPDYRWAVVGDPWRSSGFVLSRSASPSLADVGRILAVLRRNGYDLGRFELTPQSGGTGAAVAALAPG